MPLLVVAAGGAVLGFVVARWWTLAVPVALGIWAMSESELDEVPAWFIGLVYGGAGVAGVAAGIILRRVLQRRSVRS